MSYMLGILVFLGMLAVCWFGFMAAERRSGSTQLGMAPKRASEPHQTSSASPAGHSSSAQSTSAQSTSAQSTSAPSSPAHSPGPAAPSEPAADQAAGRSKPAEARTGDRPSQAS
ncbi:hypothetical protein D0Z66_08370 [Cereibacter sphaeroides]|nr:hypothetical protein D0Z66_08370 [Cereibacter sphaeroides]